MIIIPVEKKVDFDIDSFWYFQTERRGYRRRRRKFLLTQPLDPLIDGYCLTRSDIRASNPLLLIQARAITISFIQNGDLTYQIIDPVSFYKNVYIEDPLPGQVYFDVIKKDVAGLLKDVFDSAVVSTMVNFTIDEALFEKFGTVAENVKELAQHKLDRIASGIRIVSVQRVDSTWPLQVNDAFLASINASQTKQQQISEATTYARKYDK